MKKLFFVFSVLAISFTSAEAQTEKGTFLLGGSVSFQTSNAVSVFSLNPDFGLFIVDNLAVGASANVLTSSGSTSYAIGPFIRPYFGKEEKGKFFAQGSLLVGGASYSGSSSTSVGFGLGLGYALFLNQSVALEVKAEYQKLGAGSANGVFGLGAGFQIHYKKK